MSHPQSDTVAVVKALMQLRGIDEGSLASLLQLRPVDLSRWLDKADEEAIALPRQMEVLDVLGVRGDSLRIDLVHYWYVREPFFASASATYAALRVLTEYFGAAEVVFLAAEEDPLLSLRATAHFGLKFSGFYAVLEVAGSPLKSLKFDPDNLPGLSWMDGDDVGLLMERDKYLMLEPGAITPEDLSEQVTTVQNEIKWDQLSSLAKAVNVTPDQLASLVHKVANNQLVFQPESKDGLAVPAVEEKLVEKEAPRAASFSYV